MAYQFKISKGKEQSGGFMIETSKFELLKSFVSVSAFQGLSL